MTLVSLPVFPYRKNLKLHNIFVTPKMVKKVITNPDSSKASSPEGVLFPTLLEGLIGGACIYECKGKVYR